MTPTRISDYQQKAKTKLSSMAYEYYVGGARDEITLSANRHAWQGLSLHYKVLVDVQNICTKINIVDHEFKSPILIAPCAFQGLAHPQGECATAIGAQDMQVPYIVSTLANRSLEEISAVSSGTLWFQLYIYRDRMITLNLIQRAQQAGYQAIVLTVDAPIIGTRERDQYTHFHLPAGLGLGNLQGSGKESMNHINGQSALSHYVHEQLDASLTWKDLKWVVEHSQIPVLVKGIVRADDAMRAVDCGAKGIIVSNHGGRQLDTAPPTAQVLPHIAHAISGQASILVDGGIRRGTDVIKALALGADAILMGRPILWGLAVGGSQGVAHVLQLLHDELLEGMALCGCPDIASINKTLIYP